MRSSPRFSVVTVTLNCADAAIQTAQSVLTQSNSNYEYIVKDGGSTDGTIQRLRDIGVNVQVSKDTGIYNAMEQAINLCNGDYICFLNAGDCFFHENVLSIVAKHIENGGYPDLLYGDVRSFSLHPNFTESEYVQGGRDIKYPSRLSRFYLFRKMICHQSWFVKRSIYGTNPFGSEYRLLADYAFLLRSIFVEKIQYRHIPNTIVTFDGKGVTGSPSLAMQLERIAILKENYSSLELKAYDAYFASLQVIGRRVLYPLVTGKLKEKFSNL